MTTIFDIFEWHLENEKGYKKRLEDIAFYDGVSNPMHDFKLYKEQIDKCSYAITKLEHILTQIKEIENDKNNPQN